MQWLNFFYILFGIFCASYNFEWLSFCLLYLRTFMLQLNFLKAFHTSWYFIIYIFKQSHYSYEIFLSEMKKKDNQRLVQEKRVRELEEMQERELKEQEQRKQEGVILSICCSSSLVISKIKFCSLIYYLRLILRADVIV